LKNCEKTEKKGVGVRSVEVGVLRQMESASLMKIRKNSSEGTNKRNIMEGKKRNRGQN